MEDKPVVYIFHGDDTFAIAQQVDGLYAKMGDPSIADLNTVRLDGRSASDEDIRTAATSLPFLADRRLTILTSPLARLGSEPARKRFIALLDSLPETCALVLIQEDSQRWDGREKRYLWGSLNEKHWLVQWAAGAGKRALVKAFALPGVKEMPGWIQKAARERGGQFSPEAAQELAGMLGSDTRQAALEIDKLLTYVDFSRPVELEDVAELTAEISQADIFQTIDMALAGNSSQALRTLDELLEEQDAIGLFGAIVAHFRYLLVARDVLDDGGSQAEIAQYLPRQRQWMAKKLVDQTRFFTLSGLETIYRQLAQMDEDMKTGAVPPALALELFIANLKVE